MERLLTQAEGEATNKQFSEAWKTLIKSIDVASRDLNYLADATIFPEGIKTWKLVVAFGKLKIIASSETLIQRMIELNWNQI